MSRQIYRDKSRLVVVGAGGRVGIGMARLGVSFYMMKVFQTEIMVTNSVNMLKSLNCTL